MTKQLFDIPAIFCTICARGGSKGVPGKNIRPLMGIPLIAHSIQQAKATGLFQAIGVSSDSEEILGAAKAYGADILIRRPDEMATDEAGKFPAILHALAQMEKQLGITADYHVDLDATSPLRLPEDIIACLSMLRETGCRSLITGAPAHRSPYFNLVETRPDGTVGLSKPPQGEVLRRQDSPKCYDMNGSVYVWERKALQDDPKLFYPDTRIYVMPRDRSVDVDEELDFRIIEMIMEQRQKRHATKAAVI